MSPRVGAEELRLNQIQLIGTHNSYHLRPSKVVLESRRGQSLDYGHAPLFQQLEAGVRSFAIDIYRSETNFRVLHIPNIDDRSNCDTLKECLGEILRWSDRHPEHIPLIVFLEIKNLTSNVGAFRPTTTTDLEALEDQLWMQLGKGKLLTPDDLRGDMESVEAAVLKQGWPKLKAIRGKVILVLNAPVPLQTYYIEGSPLLAGRAMFVKSEPGNPEAAIVVSKDPASDETADWIRKGYLVRARADIGVKEAVANDLTKAQIALAQGCHIVTTDFPSITPHPVTGYFVALPGNKSWRVNPITTNKSSQRN